MLIWIIDGRRVVALSKTQIMLEINRKRTLDYTVVDINDFIPGRRNSQKVDNGDATDGLYSRMDTEFDKSRAKEIE